jgi:hypothetical protein
VDFVMCGAKMFQKGGFCFGGRSKFLCVQFYFLITKKPCSFKTLVTTMFFKTGKIGH